MADANVQFMGADNGTAGTTEEQRALYLKLFAGETITAFEKHTVMLDKHTVRTISAGKSAQFPVIGRMPDAHYHTPGSEITGQNVKHGEKIINIDRLLISHVFLGDLDDALRHFEVRSKYTGMMGQKLSETFDNHVMREAVIGARKGPTIKGDLLGAGKVIEDANFAADDTDARLKAWMDAFREAATNFDNKFVIGTRHAILRPEDYNWLVGAISSKGWSVIHRDYGVNVGSVAEGTLPPIFGFTLHKSPMLPNKDYTGEEFHKVDCTKTKALLFTEDLVGTVKLMGLSLQNQWDIRRQGTLMVARYAMGHGDLQPECGVEFCLPAS